MSWTERKKTNLGNLLADFSFEVAVEQSKFPNYLFFLVQPEDLGALKFGDNGGIRPASMWQWPQHATLLQCDDVFSVAFYQKDFGAGSLKPMRLLIKSCQALPDFFSTGMPCFDDQGFYAGPLPQQTAYKQLLGSSSQRFCASRTEQWPSPMCQWVAQHILDQWSFFLDKSVVSVAKGKRSRLNNSSTDTFVTLTPDGKRLLGGRGEARKRQGPGRERQFHDGAGLASLGRWDFEDRVWAEGSFWDEIRSKSMSLILEAAGGSQTLDRECFEMAAKSEGGCTLVQNEDLKQNLRSLWSTLLKKYGDKTDDIERAAPGQPFHLRLMRGLLAMADDPDREFLLQGETGFPVGVLNPLPRTPHIYEEQASWRLEEDPMLNGEVWRSNYDSVEDHKTFVEEHFAEECQEGLMKKLTMEEAKECFGEHIAISSLAVLVEESHNHKKRIIHDATHGTKVNNRIKCRDKLRSPSAREKHYLLAYFRERGHVVFSLVGDISKAHRRFLHCFEERGLLACGISPDDQYIYVNNVGTFGVASASYWWGRIAGSGIRLIHHLLGPTAHVELLLFADDLEALGIGQSGRRGSVLSFLYLSALGFPFKWSKQRGGLKVEWIGIFTDYTNMKLGLSPSRASWLAAWTRGLALRGSVAPKEMEQGLGRLGFSAMALWWERPFLGPLYTWSAAIRNKQGNMSIPVMVRSILLFLSQKLDSGHQLDSPPPLRRGLTFFTDAKATSDGAWIGGYIVDGNGSEESLPIFFYKRDLKRTIAALEMLATLVALKLWSRVSKQKSFSTVWIRGRTDNQSNTAALKKWMSTKFPLTLIIMELSETLRSCGRFLDLAWLPREQNQLADDLTNENFRCFPDHLRKRWNAAGEKWMVLSYFAEKPHEFYNEIAKRKIERPPQERRSKKRKKLERW